MTCFDIISVAFDLATDENRQPPERRHSITVCETPLSILPAPKKPKVRVLCFSLPVLLTAEMKSHTDLKHDILHGPPCPSPNVLVFFERFEVMKYSPKLTNF